MIVPAVEATPAATGGLPRTVLIVDDFPPILSWATRAFTRDGWHVHTASDAQEAMAIWRANHAGARCSLLITDLELPEHDGASLARALHAEHPQLRVVALAAPGACSRAWLGPLLPHITVLEKPVRATQLLAAASALLQESTDPDDPLCPMRP